MGVFDKIKNALFEEEYVEVEEKPNKSKKEVKKEIKKEVRREPKKEEKPIAKKVVLPEKRESKVNEFDDEDSDLDDEFEKTIEVREEPKKKEFKLIDDNDFKVEEEVKKPVVEVQPQIVKVIEKKPEVVVPKEPVYYPPKAKDKKPYGISENTSSVTIKEYGGSFEKKEDKSHFKPSPIISPIYGILDKNYKKEDVVPKKEVHITSSYAKENLNLDDVRKKAFGSLNDDLVNEMDVQNTIEEEEDFTFKPADDDANLLVDLSADEDKPAVKEVTMGDALEYFQDLGLEYNVDYVDATKDKATGRRVKDNYDEEFQLNSCEDVEKPVKEAPIKKLDEKVVEKTTVSTKKANDAQTDADSDDNLFDLIDSMYKEDN